MLCKNGNVNKLLLLLLFVVTLLYAMFVYNARREDWIQENDVSVFKNFRIDRPHVYVFVLDKKISTLQSVFKNFRTRPENTLDTFGRKPYS